MLDPSVARAIPDHDHERPIDLIPCPLPKNHSLDIHSHPKPCVFLTVPGIIPDEYLVPLADDNNRCCSEEGGVGSKCCQQPHPRVTTRGISRFSRSRGEIGGASKLYDTTARAS
ncbi:hypothetical protein CDAR_366541 [Caerostris darwini]|uniref:Uncharacterized protein n=1 Tax=Caerostris darwini TaxID=1538125 RepID=A0AAV4Q5N9_9ARAC|nr:hypothetical protein CDAR_366541 [Caerostris darwini]